jgi:hypothetical protein
MRSRSDVSVIEMDENRMSVSQGLQEFACRLAGGKEFTGVEGEVV